MNLAINYHQLRHYHTILTYFIVISIMFIAFIITIITIITIIITIIVSTTIITIIITNIIIILYICRLDEDGYDAAESSKRKNFRKLTDVSMIIAMMMMVVVIVDWTFVSYNDDNDNNYVD